MSYRETANDIYNTGVNDDKFLLLANANKESRVAVKMPWGRTTSRVTLAEIEIQGTVTAPIKCAIQVDSLGNDCLRRKKTLQVQGLSIFTTSIHDR